MVNLVYRFSFEFKIEFTFIIFRLLRLKQFFFLISVTNLIQRTRNWISPKLCVFKQSSFMLFGYNRSVFKTHKVKPRAKEIPPHHKKHPFCILQQRTIVGLLKFSCDFLLHIMNEYIYDLCRGSSTHERLIRSFSSSCS